MMRSMFSGVSGLRAHQTKMDVIGNNIANVNTVGFKASRVTFQEIYNQTLKPASAPSDFNGRGGTNPMQVGLGVSIASIDVLQTRGSVQRTDRVTDLAIDGDGFFAVGDGQNIYFTRAGNFDIDRQGNLVSSNGLAVLGWPRDNLGVFDVSKTPGKINLAGLSIEPVATTKITFHGNLDDGTPINDTYEYAVTVFDAKGNEHNVNFVFTKNAIDNQWDWHAYCATSTSPLPVPPNLSPEVGSGQITFSPDGTLLNSVINTPPPNAITIVPNTGAENIQIGFGDLVFDPDKFTQFSSNETAIRIGEINGTQAGVLTSLTIDSAGRIIGIYSNGEFRAEASLAVAQFNNPVGLNKLGDNLFMMSNNSGDYEWGMAGAGGRGSINPGALEMSNVDLAREFTEMITAQRGFQANSRIISTSDEMLQELVNLKR